MFTDRNGHDLLERDHVRVHPEGWTGLVMLIVADGTASIFRDGETNPGYGSHVHVSQLEFLSRDTPGAAQPEGRP